MAWCCLDRVSDRLTRPAQMHTTSERKRRTPHNARPRHKVGRRTRDTRPQRLPIRHILRRCRFKNDVEIFYRLPNLLTDGPRKLLISNSYQHVARGLLAKVQDSLFLTILFRLISSGVCRLRSGNLVRDKAINHLKQ